VISDGPGTCQQRRITRRLLISEGLVLGFIDAGPFLLMATPQAALAAPYHRNVKGDAAMLDVFLGPVSTAQAQLSRLRVDYVAFCPGAPSATFMPPRRPMDWLRRSACNVPTFSNAFR